MSRIFRLPLLATALTLVCAGTCLAADAVAGLRQPNPAIKIVSAPDSGFTTAGKTLPEAAQEDKDLPEMLDSEDENWSNIKALWR